MLQTTVNLRDEAVSDASPLTSQAELWVHEEVTPQ